MINFICKTFKHLGSYLPVLGFFGYFKYIIYQALKIDKEIILYSKYFDTNIIFRSLSDDSTLPRISNGFFYIKPNFVVNNFIECGSTIGITSLHFMAAYNQANFTLIEPVEENFRLLCRNLKSFYKINLLNIGLSNEDNSYFLGREDESKKSINYSKYHKKYSNHLSTFKEINNFFSENYLMNIDILYININGAEIDLFQNLRLKKNCKIVIVYIFNTHKNNTNPILEKLMKHEEELNFRIYDFHLIISKKNISYDIDTIKII